MGIGVVVIAGRDRRELGAYLGQGTNNIAELTAIERGLALAQAVDPERRRPVRVYSDSAYSIGVVGKGWKAKANQALIADVKTELAKRGKSFRLVYVPGHSGVPLNEKADELAREAVRTRASRLPARPSS
jgi:ribonuclease HI